MPRSTGDLLLAALLAVLSYAPFEYVAKTTLVVAAVLFILDPLPPYSRLIAMLSILTVALLNRTLQSWQQGQEDDEGIQQGNDDRDDAGGQTEPLAHDDNNNVSSSRETPQQTWSSNTNVISASTQSKKNI